MTRRTIAALAFIAVFCAVIILSFYVFQLKGEIQAKDEEIALLNEDRETLEAELEQAQASLEEAEAAVRALNYSKSIRTHILAARGDEGVSTPLEIELKRGSGRVLIDIEDVSVEEDVQSTAKTAFALADVKSNGELADKDAIIRITNPYKKSLSISGMSSGAIMTMGLIALGKNATLKKDVVITGTVKGNGSIGRVTDISQKAEAAKALNATVMLVPDGQSVPVSGIELVEVSDIEEAMEYMLD